MSNTQEATEWMTNMDAQLRGRALLSTHEAWTRSADEDVRVGSFRDTKSVCAVGGDCACDDARVVRTLECSGFQVHENPIFWKYVLGDLREDKTATRFRASGGWSPPAEHYNPVRDASRFVDDEFPRVSLAFDAAMCRVVTGLTPWTDEDTRSKLHSMLTKLAPLVDPVQAQHTIALKLDGYYLKSVQAIEELINDINELDRLQDAATSIWRPRFSIAELCSFNEVNPAMRLPVGCEVFRYYAKDADPPAKVADEVLSILHAHDKPFARIEILHVVRWALTASQFAVICSALPHARVLHTLDLHEPVHPMIERVYLSDEEMVWLGYALFHPDTVTSSWKRLNVGDAISKCKSAPLILQRMARGNHLISVLSGSFDQVCSAYYSAHFSDNTEVQVGSTVVVIGANARYDLCVSSDDLQKLPRLVSIVVPGFGLGTVEKSRIKTISARPPSTSTLTALDYLPGEDLETRLSTLRLLGPELTFLDATSLDRIDAATVHEILGMCPKLTSLSILHDGSYWANTDASRFDKNPFLTELKIGIYHEFTAPSRAATSTVLRELEVLRLRKWSSKCFPSSRDSIIQAIQCLPGLLFIHYDCWLESWFYEGPIPYADGSHSA